MKRILAIFLALALAACAAPGAGGGQALPANGVTLADNGKTFVMHPGESFLLNLGADTYDWAPVSDNQSALSLEKGVMVIRGAQGLYQAGQTGTAVLTVTGTPLCLQSSPPCAMAIMVFKVSVIVQ